MRGMLLPDHQRGTTQWQGFRLFQRVFVISSDSTWMSKCNLQLRWAECPSSRGVERGGRGRIFHTLTCSVHCSLFNSIELKLELIPHVWWFSSATSIARFPSSVVCRKESVFHPPDGKKQCSSFKCYESRISSSCQQEWSNHLGRVLVGWQNKV